MNSVAHLVVIGFDEIVANKYMGPIIAAQAAGHINGYSVIDLELARAEVEQRTCKVSLPPKQVHYIIASREELLAHAEKWCAPVLDQLRQQHPQLMIYIATEVASHEWYLRYCVQHNIRSLVEKPVLAPLQNGVFAPELIDPKMRELTNTAAGHESLHSVMILSRYHAIYNGQFINPLRERAIRYHAPVTSIHLRAAGGVWNRHEEFLSREDHPYKYGYGMLMHGAYHYIDVAAQLLELNTLVFPDREFEMTLSGFGAFPRDQNIRIPRPAAEQLDDYRPNWAETDGKTHPMGETDIVSSFWVREKNSDKVLTTGTLSFEQTTPSIRTWRDIPPDLYNKNGRTSLVDVEAQLSSLHAANVRVFDLPIETGLTVDRIDAFARVETRSNASLLRDEKFNDSATFGGVFHSDSNRLLMEHWLAGKEDRSLLHSHRLPMRITQALALCLRQPGQPVTIPLR